MKRNPLLRIAAAAAAAVALFYVGYLFLDSFYTLRQVRAERDEVQAQLQQTQAQHDALQRDRDYAGTDAFIQEMARELLGWVFPGEYKIVEEAAGD